MLKSHRRSAVMTLLFIMALILIGVRVHLVNEGSLQMETEHYEMGEWVNLDGTILSSRSSENPNGYSLRINSAQIVSYNEYIEEFGLNKTAVKTGLDEKSVVVLELEVRNVGNDKGGIPLLPMLLTPDRKNTFYIWNDKLWAENEPNSNDSLYLAIKRDSEYATHIPFTMNNFDDQLTAFKAPITDSRFTLCVANAPVRKVIDVVIDV